MVFLTFKGDSFQLSFSFEVVRNAANDLADTGFSGEFDGGSGDSAVSFVLAGCDNFALVLGKHSVRAAKVERRLHR